MSQFLTEAFVQQFQDDFHSVGQQQRSRLEGLVRRRPSNVVGESFAIDVLGTASTVFNPARGADLEYSNQSVERRIAYMRDAVSADLITEFDKLKMLIEPTNDYTMNGLKAINRAKDQIILDAALGSITLKDGTSSALPAGQKIANGGTGLTLAKLRQAKILLDDAEQDSSEFFQMTGIRMTKDQEWGNLQMPSYVIVATSQQIDNLLADTTVTNSDYNSVKALVAGAINTFMGFQFVRVPAAFLPKASTIRSIVAFAPNALEFGVGLDATAMVERIPNKDAWQVLSKGSFGCGRAEDAGVVQIDCVES